MPSLRLLASWLHNLSSSGMPTAPQECPLLLKSARCSSRVSAARQGCPLLVKGTRCSSRVPIAREGYLLLVKGAHCSSGLIVKSVRCSPRVIAACQERGKRARERHSLIHDMHIKYEVIQKKLFHKSGEKI